MPKNTDYTVLYIAEAESPESTSKFRWKNVATYERGRQGSGFRVDTNQVFEDLSEEPNFAGESRIFWVGSTTGRNSVTQATPAAGVKLYEVIEASELRGKMIGDEHDEAIIRDTLLNKGFSIFKPIMRNLEEKNLAIVIQLAQKDSDKAVGIVIDPQKVRLRFEESADNLVKSLVMCRIESDDVSNALRSTHYLPITYIDNTFNYLYAQSKYKRGRVFLTSNYKEIGQFHVHSTEEFLTVFIRRVLDTSKGATINGKKLTNADINAFMDVVKGALSENGVGNVAEHLKITDNHFAGDMTAKLKEAVGKLSDSMGSEDSFRARVRNLLWEEESIRKNCVDMGKEAWLKEADADRAAAEERIRTLSEREAECKAVISACDAKKEELADLDRELETAKRRNDAFNEELQKHLFQFREDVSQLALETGIMTQGNVLSFVGNPLDVSKAKKTEDAIQETAFLFTLNQEITMGLNDLVPDALRHGLSFATYSESAETLAGIISATMYREEYGTISCMGLEPSGKELMYAIQKLPNKVILVEGMLGMQDDNVPLAVMRHIPDKVFVFSIECSRADLEERCSRAVLNRLLVMDFDTDLNPWNPELFETSGAILLAPIEKKVRPDMENLKFTESLWGQSCLAKNKELRKLR